MTDDHKKGLDEEVVRAAEAEKVFNHPLFQQALKKMEDRIDVAWKDPGNGPEQREKAYMMFRLLEDFKHKFLYAMASGAAAQLTLELEGDDK